MRAVITLILFLAGLGLMIAMRAQWIVFAVWGALLIGSAIKLRDIWRSRRNPREREQKLTAGQISVLPRSWQRWILDEREDKNVR